MLTLLEAWRLLDSRSKLKISRSDALVKESSTVPAMVPVATIGVWFPGLHANVAVRLIVLSFLVISVYVYRKLFFF